MATPAETSVKYYNWEGDACRVHTHADGSITADIYRGGKGVLPVDVSDVIFSAGEISEAMYKQLVREEIALRKAGGQN